MRAYLSHILILACVISVSVNNLHADTLLTFDDPGLFTVPHPIQSAASGDFYNGDPGAGVMNRTNSDGWSYDGVQFQNSFTDFGGGFTGWTGFSFSNVNDITTPGFGNQYAAITGSGIGGTGNYALGFSGGFIDLPNSQDILSVEVTNTTYAALSMRDGDSIGKQFGGPTGSDPDFFQVNFTGYTELGGMGDATGVVPFLLADFQFADPGQDYIIDTWTSVDLSSLGEARSVGISFVSSDNDPVFGTNTPVYVALDNLTITAVPEPSSLAAIALVGLGLAVRRRKKARKNQSMAA